MKHLLKDAALWREAAYIGGAWLAETPHGRYALRNPADGALLAELPRCREGETRRAIEAAQAAFGPWRRSTAKARGGILRRWYELMLQHRDDLATLITLEEGKPLAEARGEVDYAAGFVRWFSEEATRVRGDVIPGVKETQRIVDGDRGRDERDAHRARGDLRPGDPAVPLRHRRRGHRWPITPSSASRPTCTAAMPRASGATPRASSRAWWASTAG